MDSSTFGPSYGKATLNGEVPPLPAESTVMTSERFCQKALSENGALKKKKIQKLTQTLPE